MKLEYRFLEVDSDGPLPSNVPHENGRKNRNSPPVQATIPPSSIITQVTKDSLGVSIGRPNDPNYVQSVLKGASLRASFRGAGQQNNNINGALNHSYNNNSSLSSDKKRPRIQQDIQEGLLPAKHPVDHHKKCLIIDLDETLVHSSFKVRFDCFGCFKPSK